MNRPVRAVGAALLAAALVSSATGCGADEKVGEKAIESALSKDGTKVDIDDEKVTFKDKDGNVSSFGEGVELPDSFPKEIPLPQGDYKISSVMSKGEETTMMLTFEPTELKSVEEHLKSGFTSAGYTIEDGMRIDQESGKQVHFAARSSERDVSIILMVTPEEEATAVYSLNKPQG